jgi:hypothetical protein
MNALANRWRVTLIAGLPAVAVVLLLLHGRIAQDPSYHAFASQRALWGVPNFWNVVSNLPFLMVALWGLRSVGSRGSFAEDWERVAYCILLGAVGFVSAGSSYYHLRPDNATLFWDRLPMAIVFMELLAVTIGERISPRSGRVLLFPLLALGVASVLYWRFSGDLRLYVLVQYYAVLALPLLLLLYPPRYTGTAGLVAMIALYGLALALDRYDRPLAAIMPAGGHPWKHVAAALAMLCYVGTVAHRRPLPVPQSI